MDIGEEKKTQNWTVAHFLNLINEMKYPSGCFMSTTMMMSSTWFGVFSFHVKAVGESLSWLQDIKHNFCQQLFMDNNTAFEASSSPPPSSSSEIWDYDVFLSFSGEDTRRTFTDCLYWRLKYNKVNVYIDQEELTRGEIISEELEKAIERSRISVIVFSRRYADSRWCLDELGKIMECRSRGLGQMVLPIFYDVDPRDVRKQTGSFEQAFQKHEVRFNGDGGKVQRWKSACTEAANLAGLDLRNTDGFQGKFIQGIVDHINRKLKNTYLHVATNQIGIESRVQEVRNYLHVESLDDVRIIGISGMVGTGKTTVAKAIFNEFHDEFEGKSFLSEVSGGDMVNLQNQLLCDILKTAKKELRSVAEGTKEIKERLSSMRVLVIIDDVGCDKKLDELAIKRDSFGRGSRIIITTTNAHHLRKLEVDDVYSIPEMSNDEALKLLRCHAFTAVHPEDDRYLELAKEVVKYCGGLPLALEVLGSFLCKKSEKQWKSALDKWKKMPHGPIHNKLKISYEGLTDDQVRNIFLDISCFFIGMNKDHVMTLLDGCDFYTEIGIGELHDRCLVRFDKGNNLIMHDLLRDMGREIVREKSPNIKGERCRLWDHEDVKDVLRSKSGTEKIEGLTLELQKSHHHCFSAEVFERMRGLRFLKLKGVKFTGHCQYLSEKLSWLCWHEFPLEAIPEYFNQSNIVDIDLSHSHIQVWKDSDVSLEKLKFLNLGNCKRLTQSPDFSKLPNLEKLILQGCKNLSKIHSSIVDLENLKCLDLAKCNLPNKAIPEDLGALSSLEVLDLGGNDFNKLPTLGSLSKLQTLQLDNCSNLMAIPDLPTKLEILQADECIALEEMPNFSEMLSMVELHLNHSPKLTDIPGLDKSLDSMTKIDMERCTNLTAAFKEVLRGWSAGRNDCLFLPTNDFPSSPRHVDPKFEILCCIPKFWL